MNKYLSLVFLYNRAGYKKFLLLICAIPLCLSALFFCRIGNPYEADSYMLTERAFGGMLLVLLLIAANLASLIIVLNVLNGRKVQKASHSKTAYTVRRLCLTLIASYLTIFVFNLAAVLALAGECARSCYFSWHNRTPSTGVAMVVIPVFCVWTQDPRNSYILLAMLVVVIYGALSFGDVISRERLSKGDPFKVNRFVGITDLDSMDFDDTVYLEVNSPVEALDDALQSVSFLERYGRGSESCEDGKTGEQSIKHKVKSKNLFRYRRRLMPLGINLERANMLFGAGICIGIAEHLVFYGKYRMQLEEINKAIKGVTIDSGLKIPYFWELAEHSYYGYILGILLVLFLQAYWNYKYYNKETKSVYVMKRLPDRREYARTIWGAPLLEALAAAAAMITAQERHNPG